MFDKTENIYANIPGECAIFMVGECARYLYVANTLNVIFFNILLSSVCKWLSKNNLSLTQKPCVQRTTNFNLWTIINNFRDKVQYLQKSVVLNVCQSAMTNLLRTLFINSLITSWLIIETFRKAQNSVNLKKSNLTILNLIILIILISHQG